jgi:hypothetical protein
MLSLRTALVASCATLAAAMPTAALGQAPPGTMTDVPLLSAPSVDSMPRLAPQRRNTSRAPRETTAQTVGVGSNTGAPVEGAGRSGTSAVNDLLVFRCRRTGAHRFTCSVRIRNQARTLRTCTARSRRRAIRSCRRQLGAGSASVRARAASLTWQGWPTRPDAAVGKIISDIPSKPDFVSFCSGTVISRTLVLTAGHCVLGNDGVVGTIRFYPGAGPSADVFGDPNGLNQPYGEWVSSAQTSWVATGWTGGDDTDPAADWAIIEFGPGADGRFIGDVTGSWSVTAGIRYSAGAHIIAEGYPSHGFWELPENYNGRGQYACNMVWNNDADDGWAYLDAQRGTWELNMQCPMNQGASGGPVFVQLSNGTWTIGGVNNRCRGFETATDYCNPYSIKLRTSYMDDKFTALWNYVQTQLHY